MRISLADQPGAIEAAAIAENGRLGATVSAGSVRLWDMATGEESGVLKGQQGLIRSLVFTPDSKALLALGPDGRLASWNLSTGQLTSKNVNVEALALAQDGRTLTGVREGKLRLWDLTSGREVAAYPEEETGASCLAILPDGRGLVVGGLDRTIRLKRR